MSTINEAHPIHDHLRRTLRKGQVLGFRGTEIHPDLAVDRVRTALARVGAGLDHTLGEEAIVLADTSVDPERPFRRYLLATDRRLVGATDLPRGERFDIRHGAIEEIHFEKTDHGALMSVLIMGPDTITLRLRAGHVWHDVSFSELELQLRAFLEPLMQQAPEMREPPPRPLCAPSHDDPSGATTAIAWLPRRESRTELLLTYVRESARNEAMSIEVARDFVARIVLAYRGFACGRGMHHGRFMSPVSSDDLCQLLVHLFGEPQSHVEHPIRTLVLSSNMRSEAAINALVDVVGISFALLGNTHHRSRDETSVPSFRLTAADTGPFASFELLSARTDVGLEREVGPFCDHLHRSLMGLEDALLLRRCVYGWNGHPIELMSTDPADILARLGAMVGPFDPAALGRGG